MVDTNTYKQTVEKIFARKPKKLNGFTTIATLLEQYKNPHLNYPTVHVGGTNGKGQVAGKIAYALQHAGYKVGLFISPHILDFRERITIRGEKIGREEVIAYDNQLQKDAQQLSLEPNFFECAACYAFQYFDEKKVDIAVIEVGLGGTFDATNVVQPLLSVITSIGMDHTEYLGSTIESIAEQKAGIIKQNTPVVLGPRAKLSPIFSRAQAVNAPLSIAEKKSCHYDTENQATAKEALQILSRHFPLDIPSILAGLKFSLPCRFDKRGCCIFDVAHNPDGFARLSDALEHLYPYRTFRFLIGMSKYKDAALCLKQIENKAHFIHFVRAKHDLALDTQLLSKAFHSFSTVPFKEENNVKEGMQQAKSALEKGEILVVCGSFYIMAEALECC